MRSTTFMLIGLLAGLQTTLASPAHVLERAACNGDNCLNAVKKASAVNTKDCQSFMTRTVTPCPSSTTTITTTATVTQTVGSAPHKRDEVLIEVRAPAVTSAGSCPTSTTATAPPTYAASCSGAVRYSSACSCLGVSTGTTTIASPLATSTVKKTSTSTVTAVCRTFLAQATSGSYAGQYLAYGVAPNANPAALGFVSNVTQADLIVFANGNHLYGAGGSNPDRVWRSYTGLSYVEEDGSSNENVNSKMNCTLAAIAFNGAARISCITTQSYMGGSTDFQTCPGEGYDNALFIGKGIYDGGEGGPQYACTALDLVTVPRC